MKSFILTSLILTFVKISYQQDDYESMDEGASSSSSSSSADGLTGQEKCEIWGYAESLVRLMMAEDRDGGDLNDLMNNDFEALRAFHDEIVSYFLLAERGPHGITDRFHREERLEQMAMFIHSYVTETIENACNEHYRGKLFYHYDRRRNIIVVRDSISFSSNNCLCENHEERWSLRTPLVLPEFNVTEIINQYVINQNYVSREETTQYHIIPLTLISRFFQTWLSNEETYPANIPFNNCVRTLVGRLRRSMQKFILVKLKRSLGFSSVSDVNIGKFFINNNFFSVQVLGRADGFLNGNIFLGPSHRGLSDPNFRSIDEEMLEAFEYDAVSIVGESHYANLFFLFTELRDFVMEAPEMRTIQRLLRGFQEFIELQSRMTLYDITTMNRDQWEQRLPNGEELEKVDTDEIRKLLRNRTFWAIKKRRRFTRSEDNYFSIKKGMNNKKMAKKGHLRRRWSEFISDLMEISLEARSHDESPVWFCDFTCLYNDYLFNYSKKINSDCLHCKNFGDYSYSKVSDSKDWYNCNIYEKMTLKTDWCQAWLRIMSNSDLKINFVDSNKRKSYKKLINRSESYLQDIKTIIFWLSSKFKAYEIQEKESCFVKLKPYNRYQALKKYSDPIDLSVCYLSTMMTAWKYWQDCKETFEKISEKETLKSLNFGFLLYNYGFTDI